MRTQLRGDDDIITWAGDEGERPRGCQWDETVCTQSPSHRIAPPDHNLHHDEVEIYCARHYALALARLVMVHLSGCDATLSDHVAEHGPVGS